MSSVPDTATLPFRAWRAWIESALEESRPDAVADAILQDVDNAWAVSRPLAHLLTRLVLERRRRSVLEFGAGVSSLVLASALSRAGGGRLTSIDHQPQYCEASWKVVRDTPRVDGMLVISRLGLRASRHGLMYGYPEADRHLASRGPFDLVLIDAPPGSFGRDGPLYDAYPYLAEGAIVVLDDATRYSERTAVRRWLAAFPGLELAAFSAHHGRGTALLLHNGDKHQRWAFRTTAGTVHDRVSSLLRR